MRRSLGDQPGLHGRGPRRRGDPRSCILPLRLALRAPSPASGRNVRNDTMRESLWYLLIHQLPPKPLYLRAKIRQRLDKVGAVPLKNSVYVLPGKDEYLEDLEWIAQEAAAGGGEAWVREGSVGFRV